MAGGASSSFFYTPMLLKSVERTISRERLGRYLAASNQDLVKAIRLYEANIALSECLFGVLHSPEIAVRNSMQAELDAHFGRPDWYKAISLPTRLERCIAEAMTAAGSTSPSVGKVIAELPFGFWTDLIAKRNHATLWTPCIHAAFPNAKGFQRQRAVVHRRLDSIRALRNRIAHHAPILTSRNVIYAGQRTDLTLGEIDACLHWICHETAAWVMARSRFQQAARILDQVHATGLKL